MKRPLHRLLVAAAAMGVLPSCDNVNDERIPYAPVYITFATEAEWRLYGTPAASDVRRFIKSDKLPARFPYTAMSETGFGGVMLVCDAMGENRLLTLHVPWRLVNK